MAVATESEVQGAVERTGRLVALTGLTPFVILTAWLWSIAPDHPWRAGTMLLLAVWGAATLSFLGGVRWGAAMFRSDAAAPSALTLSALPPLAGWLSVAVPAPYCFALLAVAFAAQGAWDALGAHSGALPAWYGRLRILLTAAAVAAMIVAFAATA